MEIKKLMKERCIIHIGMNKTGSSSIQNALAISIEDEDFKYTQLRSPNHSASIASLFMQNPEAYHTHVKRGFTEDQVKDFNTKTLYMLEKSFTTSLSQNHIISGEDISKLKETELLTFKFYLERFFREIIIVAYYRLPHAFIQSAFQQRVKGGLNHFHIQNMYPKYKQIFEKFDNVFSKENVKLWKYDISLFPNHDVVSDFSNRLKIRINYEKPIKMNKALSLEGLSLLYCYHKFGNGYGVGKRVIKENDLLIEYLNKLGNTKFEFSYALTEPIVNLNIKDIQWLEKRLGQDLQEVMFFKGKSISKEVELISIAQSLNNQLNSLCLKHNIHIDETINTPEYIASKIHLLRVELSKDYFSQKCKI